MDKNIERTRTNPSSASLRRFLDEAEKETEARNDGRFTPDFINGIEFALGMVRDFFRLGPGGDAEDKKIGGKP